MAGLVPDKINYPHIERFYDIHATRLVDISVAELCNTLVHSYVLVPEFGYSTLTGLTLERFFLASDRGRRKGVYIIGWRWFVDNYI